MSEAKKFFDQLAIFSDRYAPHIGCAHSTSSWGYEGYKEGKPEGAVIHYTADEDFHRVLRWFLRDKYESKSSAEVVVADRLMPHHEECAFGLPLVQKLPVTVFRCRELGETSWHATWTNKRFFGIENVCAGELRSESGEFTTWRPRDRSAPEWTMPWQPGIEKDPVPIHGRWWSPYMQGQIEANVTILKHLQDYYGSLKRPWIVGHELVQGFETLKGRGAAMRRDKRDPGPTYPIHLVRAAVFGGVSDPMWDQYRNNFLYGQEWRDSLIQNWAASLLGSSEAIIRMDIKEEVAWSRFGSAVNAFVDHRGFGPLGRVMLALLGYYFSGSIDGDVSEDDIESVRLFQRLMGLYVDGKPGPITKRALIARLADRGIYPVPN